MLDLARKAILTGVGLGLIAKDKLDEVIKTLREENNLTEEESRKLAQELLAQSEETRKKLNDLITKATKEILLRLDVPSREEITDLEKRVQALEGSISKDTSDAP